MTTRLTWVECHGYYDPAQAQLGMMLQDAGKWHGWPNPVPMVGIDGNWPVSRYPEIVNYPVRSWWRWEQITGFGQLAQYPGGYLWVADGFEAGTGDINTLIACLQTAHCKGVLLQAGHASGTQADALRKAEFDVQCWASCAQISHVDLEQALNELRPSRFVGQIEGAGERQAMVDAINSSVFGNLPWDTVIAGWGDFPAL